MKATVIQPAYFAGENPDQKIAEFLISQLNQTQKYLTNKKARL